MNSFEPFHQDEVRGFLHRPVTPNGSALALTHGASGNSTTSLLIKTAEAFSAAGWVVLRFDLPYRQKRPHGPPSPSTAQKDRDNVRLAASILRGESGARVIAGGVSYGGRQASMMLAEDPAAADGLLLLSYPLHPPGTTNLRTAHFPDLRHPALFVQGARDPFGTPAELEAVLPLIPSPTALSPIEGAGHDLKSGKFDVASSVVAPLERLLAVGHQST